MSHQESYRQNKAYAEFLAGWDPKFYQKYIDNLKSETPGQPVLDVGCGVGQVVSELTKAGQLAYGVDVSEPNIARAQKVCPLCRFYDGKQLPFTDGFFATVGALNVLEHVDEPEQFIQELARVTAPGGKVIISSPNFFRVFGVSDYHPRMRGFGNKLRNWKRIRKKLKEMKLSPATVRFDRMQPIVKEPFTPDDDAIVATNAYEIGFFLEKYGCSVQSVACTDRYTPWPVGMLLNAGPWRYLMFNAFVIAKKR